CIRGDTVRRGCELQLFQPQKAGNMDCTFCLDCLHACPHGNVGILAIAPSSQLYHDRYRSSIGRFSQRPDIAALVLLLVCGAFVNAAGMLEKTTAWEGSLQPRVSLILFVTLLLVLPFVLVSLCAGLSRKLGHLRAGLQELICSFAIAFIPLGFSMWAAHMSFHFLNGFYAFIPAAQRAAEDIGIAGLGRPDWSLLSHGLAVDWLPSLQILLLDSGFLLTLYSAWRIARRYQPQGAVGLFAPWAFMAIGLFLIGLWIIFQPMAMRGSMLH
ncbi:MAG: FesM, partial [Blastocatellia bacterium]|nr:FesM [Blastocatellia bacterium]